MSIDIASASTLKQKDDYIVSFAGSHPLLYGKTCIVFWDRGRCALPTAALTRVKDFKTQSVSMTMHVADLHRHHRRDSRKQLRGVHLQWNLKHDFSSTRTCGCRNYATHMLRPSNGYHTAGPSRHDSRLPVFHVFENAHTFFHGTTWDGACAIVSSSLTRDGCVNIHLDDQLRRSNKDCVSTSRSLSVIDLCDKYVSAASTLGPMIL